MTVPPDGRLRPPIIAISEDLPEPERPMIAAKLAGLDVEVDAVDRRHLAALGAVGLAQRRGTTAWLSPRRA